MKRFILVIIHCLLLLTQSNAQVTDVPTNVLAAVLLKVVDFELNIREAERFTIYVMEAPEVAEELHQKIGLKAGKAILKDVQSGSGFPEEIPTILYVGNDQILEKALAYSRQNKVLTVVGNRALVKAGASLGFGVGQEGKTIIYLSLSNSVKEGKEWNPAILRIAKVVH